MRPYTFTTCLSFGEDGEADYVEMDVEVRYNVIWGDAPHWGSTPETSHDGSPDEVDDVEVVKIDGKAAPWNLTPLPNSDVEVSRQIEEVLFDKCHDDMVERAREQEEAWAPE